MNPEFPEVKNNLPGQSQQTPPPHPAPPALLYLVLSSPRQEAENGHLQPTGPCPSPWNS